MILDISQLNIEATRVFAQALEGVLDSRTHKRNYLGDEVIVKGSLSKALKLPEIIHKLQRNNESAQQQAQEQLEILWLTLSEETKTSVLEKAGWYQTDDLTWDDPRSNRHPKIVSDS